MRRRAPPASMIYLGLLFALGLAGALASGATMYVERTGALRTQAEASTGGSASRGQLAIARYGCGSCHLIPGIHGANGSVGPNLAHVAGRAAIAGSLPNDPQTMVRWLMHPQKLRPGSGMPEMGVTDRDARDAAAYLYSKN